MDKWTRKYLKIARTLKEDNDSCYARSIGAVLVSDANIVVSISYNGCATKVPHPDTKEYLEHFWGLLNQDDLNKLKEKAVFCKEDLINKYEGCKTCPRRILDIPSGQRLDLCPCSHCERNAIFSAASHGISTKDCTLFCYCQIPCHECCVAIIQAKLSKIVCCDFGHDLYSPSSPGLLKMAGIQVEIVNPLEIDLK